MNHDHQTATEVLDPVCGMSIAPEDATGTVEYKGTTYYFCNPSCEEKFREHPENYAGASGELRGSRPGGSTRSSGGRGIRVEVYRQP